MRCAQASAWGGMLHIIVNNQLGFTTVPRDGRSSVHASDVAKVSQLFVACGVPACYGQRLGNPL